MTSPITRRIVIENPEIPGQGRIEVGHIPTGMNLDQALAMLRYFLVDKLLTSSICLEQMSSPDTWTALERAGVEANSGG